MTNQNFVNKAFHWFLSERIKERSERVILAIAITSYLAHLVLIFLNAKGFIELNSSFFENPIAAIYTPFSFILVYEVYLLIFYLPKSISSYIGKQYEIITLIVIRRIFKDISNLELSSNWFDLKYDLQFTYDVISALILFILIYYFYKNVIKTSSPETDEDGFNESTLRRFIQLKRIIATLLVPVLMVLAAYTLFHWGDAVVTDYQNGVEAFKDINNIFFDEFFTVLIIVDVLLLLASFFFSNEFHKIIRNSGFIISTVLIKVSFSVDGLINDALIVGAVSFGLLILIIHNKFEKSSMDT
ncbi:hypothetical protein J4050_07010 [Winogradskyella sp. DF17]|uniref:Uncharacterized protein n=1 Tax=Winogradskyella pelagia TaxID=2819984 RepID=A0ABS3T169_9FLAO|nr:hypothetical protein [Winogradskyella sp. DF17]MBO3116490.1 hypothetical protein [Winogradskyella sp. DF17]